jgi:hypothetical protein
MRRPVVRNIRGTSFRRCACGSWLDHHTNYSRSLRATCAVLGCGNDATLGAHVHEITSKRGKNWQQWIAPLCHPCNMSTDDLELDSRVMLVSANTCLMDCYLG